MTTVVSYDPDVSATRSSRQADALAGRLEQGARALAALASSLTDAQWQTRIPHDNRKIGVVVHHVAFMYPIEIQVAQTLAEGKPVTGLTWSVVDGLNANHAAENDGVTKQEALDLLLRNSARRPRCSCAERRAALQALPCRSPDALSRVSSSSRTTRAAQLTPLRKIQAALNAQKG
jgi:hypothetical protein